MEHIASLDHFQAIADPSRRQILELLSKDVLTINALAMNFDISRPAVSKHIKILSAAGFITIEDKGRERYCVLNPQGFHVLQSWINYFDEFWKDKLNALGEIMDKDHLPGN